MRAASATGHSVHPVHYLVAVHTSHFKYFWPFVSGRGSMPRVYHHLTALCYRFKDKDYHSGYLRREFDLRSSRNLMAYGRYKKEYYGIARYMGGPLLSFKIGWLYATINALESQWLLPSVPYLPSEMLQNIQKYLADWNQSAITWSIYWLNKSSQDSLSNRDVLHPGGQPFRNSLICNNRTSSLCTWSITDGPNLSSPSQFQHNHTIHVGIYWRLEYGQRK